MCYSVDSTDSLDNIEESWVPEIRHFCGDIPIILVGNKKDLRLDKTKHKELAKQGLKFVDYDTAGAVAMAIGAHAHLECSAKTRDGVFAVFEMAMHAALQADRLRKKKKRRHRCVLL